MSEDDSVKHEGKWTRYDFARLDIHPLSPAGDVIDQVVAWLNAHYPKPQPYDQGGVRGADSLLYRAERAERQRDEWKARAGAAEARTAPAVSRADVEKAIRYEFLDWEGQLEARISRAVNQTWNLVSGADPAVHVVRESDLPAARVDGDYYVVASAKGDYKWPQHGPSWWAGRAQDALAKAARYTALARLAADREEEKARELYRAATPDARWETVADEYRRIARHVLGGKNAD